MAYIPRSSFAQGPGVIPMQVQRKHTIRVFNIISTIALVLSIILYIASLLYQNSLDKKLTEAQTALSSLSDEKNDQVLKEIQDYDYKLQIARGLLDNHIAFTKIFSAVEESTKETVRFISFDYQYDPGFEAEVTMTGNTAELESVVLQKLQYLKEKFFTDFVTDSITLTTPGIEEEEEVPNTPSKGKQEKQEETGNELGVGFKVVAVFKKELIQYTGGARQEASTPDLLPENHEQNVDAMNSTTTHGDDASAVTPSTSTSDSEGDSNQPSL